MAEFRFTPYSIESFKRIARDLQRAYPLTLQQSQEVLARCFGYVDLHALQQHLKTNPTPGPQGPDAELAAIKVHGAFLQVAHELHGAAAVVPKGRREFSDLCATLEPATRAEVMAFEDEIDRTIEADFATELDAETKEYVTFHDRRLDEEVRLNMPAREGVFVLTQRGDVARRALRYLIEAAETAAERHEQEEHSRLFGKLWKLVELMPHNPYPLAAWLNFTQFSILDEDGEIPAPRDRSAAYLEEVDLIWGMARQCRSMFDALMPANFKGRIEPNLVGIRIENEPYFHVLYVGALAALVLGHKSTALSWARRSLALDPSDRVFARGIIDQVDGS